jgi:uncharacterized protein
MRNRKGPAGDFGALRCAYRFRNGDYIVIDRFPNTHDTLWVTDGKSGQARTIFPISATQFTGGPALYVVSPTRQTLTFRDNGGEGGVHVVDLDHEGRPSYRKPGAFAARVAIRQEEVTFKNGDVTLAGTLLLPAATPFIKVKRPALVFTHGSGAQSREMYWGLGYLYAARGFAVLAYASEASANRPVTGARRAFKTPRIRGHGSQISTGTKRNCSKSDRLLGSKSGRVDCSSGRFTFSRGRFRSRFVRRGLSPAETELFDSEYELTKAAYTADEVKEALAFQKLKNEIIGYLLQTPSGTSTLGLER